MEGISSTVFDEPRRLVVTLVGEGDDRRAAGAHLLDVRHQLLPEPRARRHDEDDDARLDERDRAVLHLARRVRLGAHVGELFQLRAPSIAIGSPARRPRK